MSATTVCSPGNSNSISPSRTLRSSPCRRSSVDKDINKNIKIDKDADIPEDNEPKDTENLIESRSVGMPVSSTGIKTELVKAKRNPGRPIKYDKTVSQSTKVKATPGRPGRKKARCTSTESRTSEGSTGSHHGRYSVGTEVLARWNDGLYYLGHILKVGPCKCYIKFEDGSEYWALFKDIQKGEKDGEIVCCICTEERSESPDEIVLCDNCGIGYHQKCHNPEINSEVLTPDAPWQCRQCVFASSAKKGGAVKTGPEAEALQAMKLSFTYDLNSLTWDSTHKSNKEEWYCYCGGPGDWFMKMLQCCRCRQWFHEACTQCLDKPLCYGDKFYIFVCSVCNAGPEYIKRLEMKWIDVAQLALFNLTILNNKKYYDFDSTFIPWVDQSWDRLQLPVLGSSSKADRDKHLLDALESNKTRFKSGKEIKKKVTLWGLRVRLPPQAPNVILPEEGAITDDVMNNLQMKGRKTKIFVPLESQSPIPMRYGAKRLRRSLDDSFENLRKKKQRLDDCDATSSNQSYSGYSGNNTRYSLPTTDDCTEDENTSQSTLDLFIPRPSSFHGHNHPFKLHIEQTEELEYKRLKRKLLNSYQNDDTETEETMDEESDQLDSSSYQSLEITPFPSSPQRNCSDLGPPTLIPMIPLKKKRGRKKRCEVLVEKAQKAREKYLMSLVETNNKKHKVGKHKRGSNPLPQDSGEAVVLDNIKANMKNYFGAPSRLENGEGFRVLGKRLMPDGKLQYLIEWEGLIN